MSTSIGGSATLTSVSSSATSVAILAAKGSRRGASVFNASNSILYLAFGATAAASATPPAAGYTVQVAPGGYWEMTPAAYGGAISGIWSSANGVAYVTEW